MGVQVRKDCQMGHSVRRPSVGVPKLFCFPFAGGNSRSLRKLGARLPNWLDVHYVELPGRGSRSDEGLITDMDQMVESIADELAPICTGSFAFYGHSMGAILAYRTARILGERYELNPRLLIVSGARAPHLPRPTDALHTLPDAQLVSRLERMGGTEAEVLCHDEIRDIVLKVIRADFKMMNESSSLTVSPLPCSILALGGNHDSFADQEGVEGWRFQTNSEFRCHLFDGGHFFIWNNIDEMVKVMMAELNRALRKIR